MTGAVLAFAGRRIDAPGTVPARFPPEMAAPLRTVIDALLAREEVEVVVSSGACGADLLLIDAAEARGLRARLVLPFAPETFRAASVTDRSDPEHWGARFDRAVARARAAGDLLDLDCAVQGGPAYAAATEAIVVEAAALAKGPPHRRGLAVIAVDHRPRTSTDASRDLAALATREGFELITLSTLDPQLPAR